MAPSATKAPAKARRIQAKILQNRLEQAGYAVSVAGDGAAALDLARGQKPDIIISDIDMPGMEGYELLRVVRVARPELPVILITGYPDTLARLPSMGVGNPRCFTKPFQGPELLAAVSESVRKLR